MASFEYTARASDGSVVRGTASGTSVQQATQTLAAQGLTVLRLAERGAFDPLAPAPTPPREEPRLRSPEVAERARPPGYDRGTFATKIAGPLVGQVGLDHLLFFFRQCGTMVEAGVPLVQTLTTLATQTGKRHAKLGSIVDEMRLGAMEGQPLSTTLDRYPEVFTDVVRSLTRAGEEGGFLDKALLRVADFLERDLELRNLYKRLTFMPKLQIAASILIILGANLIIGSISATATKLDSPLTRWQTWFWLAPPLIAFFLFLRIGLAHGGVRLGWDAVTSNLPIFGKLRREIAMARFGRAFGALYAGGLPMTRCFRLAADASGNEYLKARMAPAADQLDAGGGIAETFASTGAFNPLVLDMVSTGETTGSLDRMLTKMSEFYEAESVVKSEKLARVTGLFCALAVAIYIGMIVINFWTGYFGGITRAVNG